MPATCSCARATTATGGGYTPSSPGQRSLRRPHRPPAGVARRPRRHRPAGRRDRLRGDGDDAGAGTGRRGRRPRHDAPALTDVRRVPARRATSWPTRCDGCCRSGCAYDLTRRKNVALQRMMYQQDAHRARRRSRTSCSTWCARSSVPTTTSTPTSRRPTTRGTSGSCLIPNGDLFAAISSGRASVVTDRIDTFTEHGIDAAVRRRAARPTSSSPPPASSSSRSARWTSPSTARRSTSPRRSRTRGWPTRTCPTWRRRSATSTPPGRCAPTRRASTCAGCSTTSPTTGTTVATPRLRPSDRDMPRRPYIDDFSSGYVQRVVPLLPKQGDREPWLHPQDLTTRSADAQQAGRRRRAAVHRLDAGRPGTTGTALRPAARRRRPLNGPPWRRRR